MSVDVIGIGESVVDLVSAKPGPLTKAAIFERCFGGAPMNTIVGVSKLNLSAGAITAVGEDPFGDYIIKEFQRNGVDTSQVKIKKGRRTTLAFVMNEPLTGERSFIFYREPWVGRTADSMLSPEDIDPKYIAGAKILHTSGFSLSRNPSRRAVLKAVEYAKRAGVKVSFDPTLRIDVWDSISSIRRVYTKILRSCDIAAFSIDEAEFMFGTNDPHEAAKKVLEFGVEVAGIKMGSRGSLIMSKDGEEVSAPAFKVRVVDTTGAGDGWNAGLIVGLCRGWRLEECITVANAIGALIVTRRGAITAMPRKDELEKFLRRMGVFIEVG
ncbi:MAG: sugar kinase [Candidatus Bathyarchaeota archaeon]|nr:sugar kinase [Candidatus Bathyarchaeota archaeon]